jgi:hypothetical protein
VAPPPGAPESPALKAWLAGEFVTLKLPAQTWAIPGLIPGSGYTVIQARAKVGKTILAIQLAHALSENASALGFPPPGQPWKVLFIQSDEPQAEWQAQVKQVGLLGNWHTLWTEPGLIRDAHRMDAVRKIVSEGGYDLLIHDSLYTTSGFATLKDPEVVGQFIALLKSIAPGKPFILNHHKRKGQAGVPDHISTAAVGSFALAANASCLIDLNEKGFQTQGRLVPQLQVALGRDAETGRWVPVKTTGAPGGTPAVWSKPAI